MEDTDSDDLTSFFAVWKYFKIISSLFWSVPLSSSFVKYLNGETTFSASKVEICASGFALTSVLCLVFYHACSLILTVFRKLSKSRIRNVLSVDSMDLLKEKNSWEFEEDGCCVYAMKGLRDSMEDRYSVIHDERSGISLYGVYDGHGGQFAADFVKKHLLKDLMKKLQKAAKECTDKKDLSEEFAQLLTKEIEKVDLELLDKAKADRNEAGTTALVVIEYKNELIVANVGDSRGVMCDSKGNTIPLSFDHKPNQKKEQYRIKDAGGFVSFRGVWRVVGILAVSRALGDFPLKDRNLVISQPDILTFDLADLKPQFFILATDGLWDAFSNEDAVSFIKNINPEDRHRGAKRLAMQAYKEGSVDNITVLIVNFHKERS